MNDAVSKCINGIYINREYSWLQFDKRVLDQAMDLTNPLLERCKFLSIFTSNLDEFIQVRLGSLMNQTKDAPAEEENKTNMTAKEQIAAINTILPGLYKASSETFRFLKGELYDKGVSLLKGKDLSEKQRLAAEEAFLSQVLPRVSPVVLDAKHPMFKFENLKTYLLVRLERKGRVLYGVAKLHSTTPRLFRLAKGKKVHLITAEDLLQLFAEKVFPGFTIRERILIRVTRNADFDAFSKDADDEFDYDFSRLIQTRVEGRTRGDVIRLETNAEPSDELSAFIRQHLEVRKSASFIVPDHFDYKFLFSMPDYFDYERLADLRFSAARPVIPSALAKTSDLISEVRRKDIFLAYPYQSMDVLIRLLNQAADDERVTSIKITIYRLAKNSKIISALLRARENGKEVVAVMELCARFDEENNLDNAEVLQDAGCTVFYGIDDYKVHSKIISITLEEDGKISYITHIGTGNYNEGTAKQYTDLNIITAEDGIGRDGAEFFRNLAVLNLDHEYSRLLVAPHTLKSGLIKEIDREIEKGKDGVIRAKFNSLTDLDCINKLVEASKAGVKVSLVVRGICCLLPGVPGETENISVLSIVGRFLEHSRIYSFGREGEERVYIASADMMTRNLEKRVEIAVPVLDKNVRKRILSILTTIENDNVKGRRLSPDGRYKKIQSLSKMVNSQEECLRNANTL